MVPALCVAILSVGPETGTSHGPVAVGVDVGLTTSASAQALPETSAADEPVEDLVHVSVGRPYVWPSGVGILVAAPTNAGSGAAAVVRVRTTVLNESAAPYDLWAVLGPTAGYDGRSVARLADSRYAAPTAEHIVPPGRELAYETTFPAGTGRLTLQYRAGFRFEAVVVDDPGLLTGPS